MTETHELPLANRLIDDEIMHWLDTKLGLQFAAAPNDEQRKAVDESRHLHLDGYSYALTPKILDVLRRAGLLRSAGGADRTGGNGE